MRRTKFRRISLPCDAVGDLGMELQAVDRPVAVRETPRYGELSLAARGSKPGAERRHAVAVAHPHARGPPADRRAAGRRARSSTSAGGRTPCCAARATSPPKASVQDVHAVADAEHRRRAGRSSSSTGASGIGASSVVDARRAAREDDALGHRVRAIASSATSKGWISQ